MAWREEFPLEGRGVVRVAFSDRHDGNLATGCEPGELLRRRRGIADHPWTWLEQVHGARVVAVERPGAGAGSTGDAAVTTLPDAVVAVQVADCAPVLLFSPTPHGVVVAAAHAGWRGVCAGVLGAAVAAMRERGAEHIDWVLGPCISPGAYEFSPEDLAPLVDALGPEVASETLGGRPALDLRAAVRAAMADAGCGPPVSELQACTATSGSHWSHRGGDRERQAGAIWWEEGPGGKRS